MTLVQDSKDNLSTNYELWTADPLQIPTINFLSVSSLNHKSKTSLWKRSPWTSQMWLALSTTSIQDHHRLQTEDSVLTLSTDTLARETTQHTLQKMTDMLSEKRCNTLLVPIMERCRVSHWSSVTMNSRTGARASENNSTAHSCTKR